MSDALQPLREMAAKWHEDTEGHGPDLNGCGAAVCEMCVYKKLADELDAWCDAAEAWLVEQYPYATKTRRVLLGSKT